jgi:hypothetical protein
MKGPLAAALKQRWKTVIIKECEKENIRPVVVADDVQIIPVHFFHVSRLISSAKKIYQTALCSYSY